MVWPEDPAQDKKKRSSLTGKNVYRKSPSSRQNLQIHAAIVLENCLNYRQPRGKFMTEEAIIKGCLNNDTTAQRELYNKYSPKMLAVCYRFAHNREDAEDMLQEGFIKVFL